MRKYVKCATRGPQPERVTISPMSDSNVLVAAPTVPSVIHVTASKHPLATWLRLAAGAFALLLPLGLGSAAAATVDAGGAPESCVPGAAPVDGAPSCPREALLVVWPVPVTAVESTCADGRSDEASAFVAPAVDGVFYSVGDHEVSGTVDVSDGDRVTVLARTRPGVRFADDSTEAEHVLAFATCAPPEALAATPTGRADLPATGPAEPAPVVAAPAEPAPVVAAPAEAAPVVAARVVDAPVAAGRVVAGPVAVAVTGPVQAPHAPAEVMAAVAARPAVAGSAAAATTAAPRLADTGAEPWHAAVLAASMLLAGACLLVVGNRP